jgi:hypothetical protein
MKPLRQLSAMTILSLTLALPVFAGQIETPGAAASPTPTSNSTSSSTSTTNDTATSILLTIVGLVYR